MTKGNLTKQERDIIIFLRKMKLLLRNSDTLLMVFISYVREDIYTLQGHKYLYRPKFPLIFLRIYLLIIESTH